MMHTPPVNSRSPLTFIRTALSLLALFAALSLSAQTSVILGNLSSPAPDYFNTLTVANGQIKAVKFTMGSTMDPVSVSLLLQNYQSSVDAPLVQIETDNSNVPSGTVVGSFSAPASLSDSQAYFTFTATSTFALTSGTTYWLTVRETSAATGSFDWWGRQTLAYPTPTGDATFLTYAHLNGTWGYPPSRMNYFELDGTTPVPEPSAYAALLGAAAMGFIFWRRRQG